MDSNYAEELGSRNSDHTYIMEVRRLANGSWTTIKVHEDSRIKAIKLARDHGYDSAGGEMQQVR